jgi:hypothetical protein
MTCEMDRRNQGQMKKKPPAKKMDGIRNRWEIITCGIDGLKSDIYGRKTTIYARKSPAE